MNQVDRPEVLLVEDTYDDELLALRGIAKSRVNCTVIVLRDGAEALECLLSTDHTPPALIVLDYNLPKHNGAEILARIRAEARTQMTPVVIFSGTNGGPAMIECYQLGANSCVVKPDDPREYIERVALIAHYWLLVNQELLTQRSATARRMLDGH